MRSMVEGRRDSAVSTFRTNVRFAHAPPPRYARSPSLENEGEGI